MSEPRFFRKKIGRNKNVQVDNYAASDKMLVHNRVKCIMHK